MVANSLSVRSFALPDIFPALGVLLRTSGRLTPRYRERHSDIQGERLQDIRSNSPNYREQHYKGRDVAEKRQCDDPEGFFLTE